MIRVFEQNTVIEEKIGFYNMLNKRYCIFFLLMLFACMGMQGQERILMKHDRVEGCFPGDSIHVSLRVTCTKDSTRSSNIVYVDLLMPDGTRVDDKCLYIGENGEASCDVWIDSIHPSGFYELRAYTRGMTAEQFNMKQEGSKEIIYASNVIPVYSLADKEHIDSNKRHINLRSYLKRERAQMPYAYNWYKDNPRLQYVEKQPMFVGRLVPRTKDIQKILMRSFKVDEKKLTVVIQRDTSMFVARSTTDKYGRFGCMFPNAMGDYMIKISGAKGENLSMFYVVNDAMFAPVPRKYNEDELFDSQYDLVDDKKETYYSKYYDIASETEYQKSFGVVARDFLEGMKRKDWNFISTNGVIYSPRVLNSYRDKDYNISFDINLLHQIANDSTTVCMDGMTYKKDAKNKKVMRKDSQGVTTKYNIFRPIVWIVNGKYRLITGLEKKITDFKVLRPSTENLPMSMDEVKSLYITEDPSAYAPFVQCSVLDSQKPVTVFITTHKNMLVDDSALYSGMFKAPDLPQ